MLPPVPEDAPPRAVDPGRDGRAPRPPTAFLVALAGVAALVVGAVVAVAARGGDGTDTAGTPGGALGGAASPTSLAPNVGTVTPTSGAPAGDGGGDGADAPGAQAPAGAGLPPVTIPDTADPPAPLDGEAGPGPGLIIDPISGEEAPEIGVIRVDVDPGTYQDFPVYLREDQQLSLVSLADDFIRTEIEVFAPDGTSEGWWAGGEPEVMNGLEWYAGGTPLPTTGVYVIRVIHTGGNDGPFGLGFYGDA